MKEHHALCVRVATRASWVDHHGNGPPSRKRDLAREENARDTLEWEIAKMKHRLDS